VQSPTNLRKRGKCQGNLQGTRDSWHRIVIEEDGGLGVKARDNDDERHSVRHQSGNERDVARETIELSCSRSRRLEAQVVSLALKEGACQTKGLPVGRPFFAFREMSIVQCSNETDIDTF
jgi:hypothetical protein